MQSHALLRSDGETVGCTRNHRSQSTIDSVASDSPEWRHQIDPIPEIARMSKY